MKKIARVLSLAITLCACNSADKLSNNDTGRNIFGNWASKYPQIKSDDGFQTKIGIYPDGKSSFEKQVFAWSDTSHSWTIKSDQKSSPNSEYLIEKDYLIMKIRSLTNESLYTWLSPKYEINNSGNLFIHDGLFYEGSNKALIGVWTSDYYNLENGEKKVDTFYVSQDSILNWRYGNGIKISISNSAIFKKLDSIPYLNYEILNGKLFIVPQGKGFEYFRY